MRKLSLLFGTVMFMLQLTTRRGRKTRLPTPKQISQIPHIRVNHISPFSGTIHVQALALVRSDVR